MWERDFVSGDALSHIRISRGYRGGWRDTIECLTVSLDAVLRGHRGESINVRDHEDMRPEFERTVAGWLRSGDVVNRQTVTDGIDHAVEAFLGMLKGGNVGKALVRLDTDWEV